MDYKNIYENLILKAKSENRRKLKKCDKDYVYYEKHHIIPRCLNGSNLKDNLILFTPKEHFVAHKLLIRIYPNAPKLINALWMMSTTKRSFDRNYIVGSREYSILKIEWNKSNSGINNPRYGSVMSEKQKEILKKANTGIKRSEETRELLRRINLGKPSKIKGIKRSEETKEKLRQRNIGTKASEQTKNKMSLRRKGVPKSQEHKDNISKGRKGKVFQTEDVKRHMSDIAKNREKIECPWCKRFVCISTAHRWHFENCKKNPNNNEEEVVRKRRESHPGFGKISPIKGSNFKKQKIQCPVCGFIGAGWRMKVYHFDNCKHNKNEKF